MTSNTVLTLLQKNRIRVRYPNTNVDPFCSDVKINDILCFGFSYIEHTDNLVDHVIANPILTKKIIQEVNDIKLSAETEHIADLWTAKLYMTNKISDNRILFSDRDQTITLDLDLHNI